MAWENLSNGLNLARATPEATSEPPSAFGAASATNRVGAEFVEFGGVGLNGRTLNFTWVFSWEKGHPATWQNVSNRSTQPLALSYASMAFDSEVGEFVMFGGLELGGAVSNLTWVLNTTTWRWSNYSSVACFFSCPVGREMASLAFDSGISKPGSILFGGCRMDCRTVLNDTWNLSYASVFHALVWKPIPVLLAPTGRDGAPMVAIPSGSGSEELVLSGGEGLYNESLQDVWTFDAGTWQNRTSPSSVQASNPDFGAGASLVYDNAYQSVIAFGGNSPEGGRTTTAALECNATCNWTNITQTAGSLDVSWAAVSSDTNGSEPIVFGGVSTVTGAIENSTWALQPNTTFVPTEGPQPIEVNETLYLNDSLFGGTGVGGGPDQVFTSWITANATASWSTPLSGTVSAIARLNSTGNWTIRAICVDSWGYERTFVWVVSPVYPAVTLVASNVDSDPGIALDFNATILGELVPLPSSFAWSFGDGTIGYGPNVTHAFSGPGTYEVEVVATDGLGNTALNRTWVNVSQALRIVSLSIPSHGDALAITSFSANVTGGTGPLHASWTFGDGTSHSDQLDASHIYRYPGNFSVKLIVADGLGSVLAANATIRVSPALSVEITSQSPTPIQGSEDNFSVLIFGGTPDFTTSWSFGDGATANGTRVVHAFATSGDFGTEVRVADGAGQNATASLEVQVQPSPSAHPSGGSSPQTPFGLYLLIGGLAVVASAAVFAALTVHARRRNKH